jgi:hypothetical protein
MICVLLLLKGIFKWKTWRSFVCFLFYTYWQVEYLYMSSRLHQFKCGNIPPTLDVFRCLMVTNLAVLHWTISNWFISPFLQWSQGEQAYLSDGLIRDFFTEVELALRFRFRKPIVLLDFVQMFWKWYFHFNSSLIEKDDHGGRSSIWLDVYFEWQTFDWMFISSDRQNATFVCMKNHFPFSFSYCKFVEILFQILGIDGGFNSHDVCNGVVCK